MNSIHSSDTPWTYDASFVQKHKSFKGSDKAVQERRVNNLAQHALAMLHSLNQQDSLNIITHYTATIELAQENYTTETSEERSVTNPKEIRAASKKFKKEIKEFEKTIAKTILSYQINVLRTHVLVQLNIGELETLTSTLSKEQVEQIEQLARGGIRAIWIRTKALFFSSDKKIVTVFNAALQEMITASQKKMPELNNPTEVEKSQQDEFTTYQTTGKQKRDGVLSVGHTFRFVPSFQEDKVLKQFKSFCAQRQSLLPRETIKKELSGVKIKGEAVISTLTPLNTHFDELTQLSQTTFTKIHGETGSSSAHREGHHLSNAYLSQLSTKETTFYSAIRHAILSSNPKQTDKTKRKADAEQQAKELLTAAVMKDHMNNVDITAKQYKPTIISTSLVTPFLISQGERQMWDDQREALSALNGKPIEIQVKVGKVDDESTVKVTPQIHAFNFGVNKGAVKFGLGAIKQYFQNRRAIRQLTEFFNTIPNTTPSPGDYKPAQKLLQEIQHLTRTPWSYLGNGNQYEVGAKLVCLANLLDAMECSSTAAINCKSAKDRSQVLDCVAKTFMTMYKQNGDFPSSEQLKIIGNNKIRTQFKDIFSTMLKESGGLEITELNTGALGLKVDEMILICGFTLEELLDIQGTSATTGA